MVTGCYTLPTPNPEDHLLSLVRKLLIQHIRNSCQLS